MVASRSIFVFFNERAAASEKILTTASEGKCAAYVFFVCVAASTNILKFFNERAAASEIYLLKEKMYGCF